MECPSPQWPMKVSCSSCISISKCLCPDGWMGQGDFVVDYPICDKHILTIQILYGANVFIGVIGLISVIIIMLKKHTGWWTTSWIGLNMIIVDIIMAVLHVVNPMYYTIGRELITTMCFTARFILWSFFTSRVFTDFIDVNIKICKIDVKNFKNIMIRKYCRWLGFSFNIIMAVMPLFMMFENNIYRMRIWGHIWFAMILLANGILTFGFMVPEIQELINNVELIHPNVHTIVQYNKLLGKLNISKLVLKVPIAATLTVCFVFAVVPLITSFTSYFLPCGFLIAPIIVAGCLYATIPNNPTSASSSRDLNKMDNQKTSL